MYLFISRQISALDRERSLKCIALPLVPIYLTVSVYLLQLLSSIKILHCNTKSTLLKYRTPAY